VTMPWYASAEQVMRDRSEYARKGIARGRSVVVLTYADGVVFVAENPSTALHKVSEIYDRIGYAAVGRYNEYDNLRAAGVRYADLRGYSYDRRDVTGRALANVYSQTLGAIFTEQQKPFEVEICVAEVGDQPAEDQLYRLSYDGSIADEPEFVVLGGHAEAIANSLRGDYQRGMALRRAVALAVRALSSVGGENNKLRELTAAQLEVAVLDRKRPKRKFRRLAGAALQAYLTPGDDAPAAGQPGPDGPGPDGPTREEPPSPDGSGNSGSSGGGGSAEHTDQPGET
jgi:proteasome alpha subunit